MDFCEKLLFFKDRHLVQNSKTNQKRMKNPKQNAVFLAKTKSTSGLEFWILCLPLPVIGSSGLHGPQSTSVGALGPLGTGAASGTVA